MDSKIGHEKEKKETASAGFCLSSLIFPEMHLRIVFGLEYMRPLFQLLFLWELFTYIKLPSTIDGFLGLAFLISIKIGGRMLDLL